MRGWKIFTNFAGEMEPLKHECGIALVRLLKPLDYYQKKYGSWMYGLNKLYLMMEKQHNRGQEGAGIACVKMKAAPGEVFFFRERAEGSNAIKEVFAAVHRRYSSFSPQQLDDADSACRFYPFAGEIYMGHLRYSTTGRSGISFVHPFMRRSNWRAKNLCICANFNMTNVEEIFEAIAVKGQHPRMISDTYILLEQLGHRLDRESERCFQQALDRGLTDTAITEYIERNIDVARILEQSAGVWDGGYVLCGTTGSGELFTMRDPWGIRPAFWYKDDEVLAIASERPVIQTTFNVDTDLIHEIKPGEALVMNQAGRLSFRQILPPKRFAPCSFERVYFSRGCDRDIYRERKQMGINLVPPILEAIDHDTDHAVFSYIPNTAEAAFYGMVQGLNEYLNAAKAREIIEANGSLTAAQLERILSRRIRTEKVAWKDIKLRTFISEGASRNDLAGHVYDITYGSLQPGVDQLVVIDDSIVRGTTLRESIIRILDRLGPRRIVIVSSSSQVRYPDYYGIDMARMDEFIAFRAAMALAEERGLRPLILDIYERCKAQANRPKEEIRNLVKELYDRFTEEEISAKMAEMLRPEDVKAEVKIVYQSLEGHRAACPGHPGDWYFSGDYPTPGGLRRLNQAFIDFIEEKWLGQ